MSIQYAKPRYGPLFFLLNVSTALKGTHNYIFNCKLEICIKTSRCQIECFHFDIFLTNIFKTQHDKPISNMNVKQTFRSFAQPDQSLYCPYE